MKQPLNCFQRLQSNAYKANPALFQAPEKTEGIEMQAQSSVELKQYRKLHESMQSITGRIKDRTQDFNDREKALDIKRLEKKRARLERRGKPIDSHLYPKLLELVYTDPKKGVINVEDSLKRVYFLDSPYRNHKGSIVNDLTKIRHKALESIKAMLENLQDLEAQEAEIGKQQKEKKEAVKKMSYEDNVKQLDLLYENFQEETKRLKQKNAWEDKPAFNEMKSDFNLAIKNPILKDRTGNFEAFYTNGSEFSSYVQADMENWYFAYLAVKTDGFNEAFVFGDEETFGENHKENAKQYPKVYAKWLEMNGIDTDKLDERQRKVDEKEKKINALQLSGELPPLKAIIAQQKGLLESYYGLSKEQSDFLERLEDIDKESIDYWAKQEDWLGEIIERLGRSLQTEGQNPGLEKALEQLIHYQELADLEDQKHAFLVDQNEIPTLFVRSELNTLQKRQQMQELSMDQFKTAVERLDPFRDNLHPSVRGVLFSSIAYSGFSQEGVDKFGKGEDNENNNGTNWMLAQVSKSPDLNATAHGKKLSAQQHEALAFALAGSNVIDQWEESKEKTTFYTLLLAWKIEKNKAEKLKKAGEIAENYPYEWIEEGAQLTQKEIKNKGAEFKNKADKINEFRTLAEKAIFDVYSPEFGQLHEKIQNGKFEEILSDKEFKDMLHFQYSVEINHKTLHHEKNNQANFLGALGINVQGFAKGFEAAKEYDKSLKDIKIQNLTMGLLSTDPVESKKYYKALRLSLPHSREGGEDKLLAGVRVIQYNIRHGKNLKDFSAKEAMIIQALKMIEHEGKRYLEGEAMADRKNAEIQNKLSPKSYLDHCEDGLYWVVDGVRNWESDPGTALLCGALIGGAFYLGSEGLDYFKSNDTSNLTKLGLLGTAAGLVYMEATGTKLSDITGINSLDQVMEGTHESVLLEKGRDNVENERVYAKAIHELNKGSVEQWLDWYNNTDENGGGRDDLLPYGVSLDQINPGSLGHEINRKITGRRALRQAIEQMALYVSDKRNQDPNIVEGMEILDELYVKAINDPNYKPEKADSTLPPALIAKYHEKPNGIPWEEMIEVEIDMFDVAATIGKNGITPALDYLELSGEGFVNWGRHKSKEVLGFAKNFWPGAEREAEQFAEFLMEVGDKGGKKMIAKGRELKFYFEGEVYHVLKNSFNKDIQLVKEGAKTLGGAIIFANDKVADIGVETLRGMRAIAVDDDPSILNGSDLALSDIVAGETAKDIETMLNTFDRGKNYGFDRFGFYQRGFYKAADSPGQFFKTPKAEPGAENYFGEGIGYHFTRVTLAEVGLTPQATGAEKKAKMYEESIQRARRRFKKEGLNDEQIGTYVSQIHVMRGLNPEIMIIGWRAPLPGSPEFYEKGEGLYTGLYDAAEHKYKLPFKPDPNQDIFTQIAQFTGYTVGTTGVMLTQGGVRIASYGVTIPFESLEAVGGLTGAVLDFATGDPRISGKLKELTHRSGAFKTDVAEFTTQLEYAPFYENSEENRNIYNVCLEYATNNNQRLYLGVFQGVDDYEGRRYLKRPSNFNYGDLKKVYSKMVAEGMIQKTAKFETLIDREMAKEKGETPAPDLYHLDQDGVPGMG